MAPCSLLRFLVLCYFPFLLLAESGIKQKYYGNCPLYSHCGNLGDIYFPFSNTTSLEFGLPIRGCDNSGKKAEVQLWDETWCEIESFHRNETQGPDLLVVQDNELQKHLPKSCSGFDQYILPLSPYLKIFHLENIITMYRCNRTLSLNFPESFFNYSKCPHYDILYSIPPEDGNFDQYFPTSSCSKIQVPFDPEKFPYPGSPNVDDPFIFMTSKLHIKVNLPQKCVECYKTGDICSDEGVFYCSKAAAKEKPRIWKVMVGFGVGCPLIAILIIGCLIGHRLHQRKHTPSDVDHPESRDSFADPDPESDSVYFRVPLFSYEELQEATKNFDREREIGAGGFGTVYYGNIRDGREVAVKRLYQRNYKRFKHFMNEVEILTRLRHRNLVSLYGCTSHHSRESLLVYEYIPNGTVACHLHGGLARPGSLPWSVRMRIAIETATALAYLHACGIIHRDVKTKNVLLDNHFCVKVADFGLSRFFPDDVTHVSTDPHGTPGYLDPEYYECYQLSDKSDVYSFGVVLIELISSLPAVDMTRRREEVNLASLAKRKIQDSALSELVDHSLGFESDNEVKRMIVSVAELAFQCLQLVRGLRPSMDQVLEMLKRIENGTDYLTVKLQCTSTSIIEESEATVPSSDTLTAK